MYYINDVSIKMLKSTFVAHLLLNYAHLALSLPLIAACDAPHTPTTTDLASLGTPPTGSTPAIDQSLQGWQGGGGKSSTK